MGKVARRLLFCKASTVPIAETIAMVAEMVALAAPCAALLCAFRKAAQRPITRLLSRVLIALERLAASIIFVG